MDGSEIGTESSIEWGDMAITIKRISKQYERFDVLQDIDFTVNNGELTALLGPSGCGKTTLLRIIAGLESASADGFFSMISMLPHFRRRSATSVLCFSITRCFAI